VAKADSSIIRRNVQRLAPLGLSVLRDCGTGALVVKEMHGGVADFVAEFATAEGLDGFLNPG
jgi:hypothetical protein